MAHTNLMALDVEMAISDINFFSLLYAKSPDKNQRLNQRAVNIFNEALRALKAKRLNENAEPTTLTEQIILVLKQEYDNFPADLQDNKDALDMLGLWDIKFQEPYSEDDQKLISIWMILIGYPEIWKRKKTLLDKLIETTANAAEAANIGIGLHMASQWISFFACGIFATIAYLTDPIIYFCRASVRGLRLIGRSAGLVMEEEANGFHPWQKWVDVLCLSLFLGASLLLIIGGPVWTTAGFATALIALSFIAYFDYYHQETLAKVKLDEISAKIAQEGYLVHPHLKDLNQLANYRRNYLLFQFERAESDYVTKRNSRILFVALLIGLTFLLICGTAAAFAPPVIVPWFLLIAKFASAYLAVINAGRFMNGVYGKINKYFQEPVVIQFIDGMEAQYITPEKRVDSAPAEAFEPAGTEVEMATYRDRTRQVIDNVAAQVLPNLSLLSSNRGYEIIRDMSNPEHQYITENYRPEKCM